MTKAVALALIALLMLTGCNTDCSPEDGCGNPAQISQTHADR